TQGSSVATLLDILCSKGNSLFIGVGLPLQQEICISPSLFHGSVGPTVVSLPSTSPAHGSVVAASTAADVDFYTALPLLPSPPSSSASIFQPPAQPLAASRCCTLPAAVATSSTKSSPSSPASPQQHRSPLFLLPSTTTTVTDGSDRSSNCFPCILLYCCSFLSQ
ncbi:hypothetical protein GW17_00015092, partial [Ensete ventricosum]